MDREAIEAGRDFERDFAKRIGGQLVPGSGNKWFAKLDVANVGVLLWSLKHTDLTTFPLSQSIIDEAVTAITDVSSGEGGSIIPGIAVEIGKKNPLRVCILLEDDLLTMFQEQIKLGRETRGEAIRRKARVPQLLREEEE